MGRWFIERAVPFDILERGRNLGGLWDFDRPDTPLYESAHFISSKTLSAFRDWPMPREYPDYPHHSQIFEYIESYADHHRLRGFIEFGAEVTRVERDGDVWNVRTSDGKTRRYAGVVVANGHNWDPHVPELPGRFDGQLHHAIRYRSPDELRGKRVLVIGGGNSGCDIAADAAVHSRQAFLSVRRGYHFIPKHILGKPADVFAHGGPHLPMWLAQPLFQGLLRLIVGDLTRFGLPKPDHRIFESHPLMNTQVLHHMAHGDLTAKPDVRETRGDRVIFQDGSEEKIDLILLATGYQPSIPFLDESTYRTGDLSELFLNVFHRRQADLFVVGLFENDGAAFPIIDRQCQLIAKWIAARTHAPAKAARFEKWMKGPEPDFTGGVRFLNLRRMSTQVMTHPYTKYLDRALELFR
jgi:cation diffusion facilitator CzcD-associated flavoprotein CzcO